MPKADIDRWLVLCLGASLYWISTTNGTTRKVSASH